MILIKSQSSIVVNALVNNAFVIIVMSKNDDVSVHQKNTIFDIKRSTFKNHALSVRKSPLNTILKVSL